MENQELLRWVRNRSRRRAELEAAYNGLGLPAPVPAGAGLRAALEAHLGALTAGDAAAWNPPAAPAPAPVLPPRPAAPPPPPPAPAPATRPNRWLIATIVLGVIALLSLPFVILGWSGGAEATETKGAVEVTREVVVEKEVLVTVEVEKEKIVEKPVVQTVMIEKRVVETVVVEKEVVVTATPGPPTATPTHSPTPTPRPMPTPTATTAVTQTITAAATISSYEETHNQRLLELEKRYIIRDVSGVPTTDSLFAWMDAAGFEFDRAGVKIEARQVLEELVDDGGVPRLVVSGVQLRASNFKAVWMACLTSDRPMTPLADFRSVQPDPRNPSIVATNVAITGTLTAYGDCQNWWGTLGP